MIRYVISIKKSFCFINEQKFILEFVNNLMESTKSFQTNTHRGNPPLPNKIWR